MPVKLAHSNEWLKPTTEWNETTATNQIKDDLQIDKNFYITVKKL
jgi:hypothetical protein